MEAIKEITINTTPIPTKVWNWYVDDSFCIIKRNGIDSFHNTLNSNDQHISLPIEENDDKIKFTNYCVRIFET